MHHLLMDLIGIIALRRQVIAPLLTQVLGKDVLDRQFRPRVNGLRMSETLLKAFEDNSTLVSTPGDVERPIEDRRTDLIVGWPITSLTRKIRADGFHN